MSDLNLNNITNKLLLKYDDNFNELYDKKVNIDSSIMNKEELILKEHDEILKKEQNIAILQYSLFFSILFGVLLILYGLNKFDFTKLILYTIILFLIYAAVVYFNVYYKLTLYNAGRGLRNAKVIMNNYAATLVEDVMEYKCPTTCPPINPVPPNPATISGYKTPTLRTDPQLNVWEYGTIPPDLWTSDKKPSRAFYKNYRNIPNYNASIEEESANEAKPFFGAAYPKSTYYKCEWLGGNNNGGLPNIENNKYSSIPCTYRPNYTEKGRYICSRNPNEISEGDMSNYCDDVSSSSFIVMNN